MKSLYTRLLGLLLLPLLVQAQSNVADDRAENPALRVRQQLMSMTPEQRQQLRPGRKPAPAAHKIEAARTAAQAKSARVAPPSPTGTPLPFPNKMIVPGEHEEIQATLVAWPSYAFDAAGDIVDPDTPGMGWKFDGGNWVLVPIVGFEPDTFLSFSTVPAIWGRMAHLIQSEVPAWIVTSEADDSVGIKQFMTSQGYATNRIKFINSPIGTNAFWIRDWGPLFVYQGNNDELGMIDLHYYPGRSIDDRVPSHLADKLGVPRYETSLELEGGNFFTDGYGKVIVGDVAYDNNSDTLGYDYAYKAPLSNAKVRDTLKTIFGADTVRMLRSAVCDGGTGHIDIYMRQLDEEKYAITAFPATFNNPNFPDYGYYNTNNTRLQRLSGPYNRGMRLPTVSLPTKDNGQPIAPDCDTMNNDARNFINGIAVNKLIVIPTYSSNGSGNAALDQQVLNRYRQLMPGYRVEGIDCREMTPWGGALHCVTMQVPAPNPLRIWHPYRSGEYVAATNYPLVARITNRSGIASAKTYWRKKGVATWDSLPMTLSSGDYTTNIPGSGIAEGDTIEYFLSAVSNNGKTMRKPLPAPAGFYSFSIKRTTDVAQRVSAGQITLQPNPATGQFRLTLANEQPAEVTISDVLGRRVHNTTLTSRETTIDCATWHAGMYFVRVSQKGQADQVLRVVLK